MTKKKLPVRFTGQHFTIDKVLIKDAIRQANISNQDTVLDIGAGKGFLRLSGNFWLVSFKISYLCLPLFYETRTTPSCHPSGCAYRQL